MSNLLHRNSQNYKFIVFSALYAKICKLLPSQHVLLLIDNSTIVEASKLQAHDTCRCLQIRSVLLGHNVDGLAPSAVGRADVPAAEGGHVTWRRVQS